MPEESLQNKLGRIGKSVFTGNNRWFAFIVLLLLGLIILEHIQDPYRRTFTEIPTHGTNTTVIAVVSKTAIGLQPTVIYLHGSRGRALTNGKVLRQFADAGLAAVTMEYSQSSQADFKMEMQALQAWLQQQSWADTNRIVWVGFSLGAQRMLEQYIAQPGQAPQLLVRVAGGLVDGLRKESEAKPVAPKHTSRPKVLLFHGESDRVFPLSEAETAGKWFKAQGNEVSQWTLPQAEHAFGQDREWVFRCVVDEVAREMNVPRIVSRPKPALLTAKIALGVILLFAAICFGPRLLKPTAGESKTLRKIALAMFALALIVTAYHLIAPRLLPASYAAWFQHALGSQAEREDFRRLAGQPEFQWASCDDLLQQARLAHFRKSFLYSELDDTLFRECVLSPKIGDTIDLNWRWPLWLDLYPKIRKCANAEEATVIVVKAVREQLGLPTTFATESELLPVWASGRVNPKIQPKFLVAALRSVGVASRLSATGRAEFWTGKSWKPVVSKDNPFDIQAY